MELIPVKGSDWTDFKEVLEETPEVETVDEGTFAKDPLVDGANAAEASWTAASTANTAILLYDGIATFLFVQVEEKRYLLIDCYFLQMC